MATLKAKLKQWVEDGNTPASRGFDYGIQALIVLSLIAFSLETLPDLPAHQRRYLELFEVISVTIFSLEYLTRLFVADNKLRFIFSFYGLIDLFAVLPFFISKSVDLRSIRVIRLLRLIRILRVVQVAKLARYSKAVERFSKTALRIREELILFLAAACMLIFFAALGIYHFEYEAQPEQFSSIFHSLWWAVITLTTVGYGDVYPITLGGRIFTFVILLTGLGIMAVPTALIASALTMTLEEDRQEEEDAAASKGLESQK